MSIALRHISLAYGDRRLLENVSADFAPQTLTALIGRNGTGKEHPAAGHRGTGTRRRGQRGAVRPPARGAPAPAAGRDRRLRHHRQGPDRQPPLPRRRGAGARAPPTGSAGCRRPTRRRGPRAGTGRHERLRPQDDGPDVRRRMPARDDRPGAGATPPPPRAPEPRRSSTSRTATRLASLLRRLAATRGKCILFSTHDLDIALSLCDAVALIDTPSLHLLPAGRWLAAASSRRLFAGESARFDPETRTVEAPLIPRKCVPAHPGAGLQAKNGFFRHIFLHRTLFCLPLHR